MALGVVITYHHPRTHWVIFTDTKGIKLLLRNEAVMGRPAAGCRLQAQKSHKNASGFKQIKLQKMGLYAWAQTQIPKYSLGLPLRYKALELSRF